MTDERTQTIEGGREDQGTAPEQERRAALVVAWSSEPQHVGELLLFARDGAHVFGRGQEPAEAPRALLTRQRPGMNQPGTTVDSAFISRRQLAIEASATELRVANQGKALLRDRHGETRPALSVRVGDTLEVQGQFLFLCVERPGVLPSFAKGVAVPAFEFGAEDAFGFVGESEVAWRAREHLAFLGERSAPVLILGPSGAGKELAARSIHGSSSRRARKLITRNAATIPQGLAEAELFGNIANYPNPGMPERLGLVGEAQGSTLFLDEIGELEDELQARLLRLLEADGDYQRLGDARPRRSDLRILGATNRSASALRTDIAARFKLRLTMPGLEQRPEDVPLIWRKLAQRIASADPPIAKQFFEAGNPRGELRQQLELVRALLQHPYTTHVRELERFLWCAVRTSSGNCLELTGELRRELGDSAKAETGAPLPDAETVRAALSRANGVQELAWRNLGLSNRYVLKRLVKKYGLTASGRDDGVES